MRVLITGGAGFIGSHLLDRLLARGDEVCVLDNLSTGRKENLPTGGGERYQFHWQDIAKGHAATLLKRFKPEVVVHCAASYKDPNDWWRDIATNVQGTANMVKASKEVGVQRFIYLQTALCYGLHPKESPVTLDHPLNPQVSYAISKTAGEQYIMNSGLDYVSFRLANAYGPRNLSGAPPTWFKRLSEGKSVFAVDARRDMVYVYDIVQLILMAIGGKGKGVYHASSGRDWAMKDVLAAMLLVMGKEQHFEVKPRAPEDAPTLLLDPKQTIREFGWMPEIPLEDGIKRAVDWYQGHPMTETYTHLSRYEEAK